MHSRMLKWHAEANADSQTRYQNFTDLLLYGNSFSSPLSTDTDKFRKQLFFIIP
jgi:hypothetical protein